MNSSPKYTSGCRLAIDLGATSGRIILEQCTGNQKEIYRFPTPLLRTERGVFWDFPVLLQSIVSGLAGMGETDAPILSLSCDSWAQDFGLLDSNGELLELPYSYRDTSCDIHSNCRLAFIKEKRPELYARAHRLLHIADLVHYYLCGAIRPNYSLVAISKLPLDHRLLAPLADCEIIGTLNHKALPHLRGVPVISGAGHDTAAAYISGSPHPGEAFISLGTWYMAASPCTANADYPENFGPLPLPRRALARTTGGMGLWPFQQCVKLWEKQGTFPGYDILTEQAENIQAVGQLSPQSPSLFSPDNMEEAIWHLLGYHATPAQITKLLFEGLARDLGTCLKRFKQPFTKVILAGGASANPYLKQLLQAQLSCPLVSGEREATTSGNLAIQHSVI